MVQGGEGRDKPRESRGVEVAGLVEGRLGKGGVSLPCGWDDRMGVEKTFPKPKILILDYLKENKNTIFYYPEITSIYTLVYILSAFICVYLLFT